MSRGEGIVTAEELVERVMTEHWDFGACPCTFCKQGRLLGLGPKSSYPTTPKVSILYDGSKEGQHPIYNWDAKAHTYE